MAPMVEVPEMSSFPCTENVVKGEVDPTPTLPVSSAVRMEVEALDTISRTCPDEVAYPLTANVA